MRQSTIQNTICDLAQIGLVKINGPDAKKLLQGQLTCHMDEVTDSQSRMAALCNPKGRVISLFYVFLFHDSYYLFMPPHMVALTMAALKKFAVFYKAELSNVSDQFTAIGLAGPDPKQPEDGAVIQLPAHTKRHIIVGNIEWINQQWQHLAKESTIVTAKQWKLFDLIDGISSIYPDTSGKFLPHEINLDKLNALHFDKGCYTGQEIIARIQYRGKLKTHLYQASITAPATPSPGMDIYCRENQDIHIHGTLVDVYHSEHKEYDTLIVSDDTHAKNHHLFLETNEKNYFKFK